MSGARAEVVVDDAVHRFDLAGAWQYQLSPAKDASRLPPEDGYQPATPRPDLFDDYGNAYWFRTTLVNESEAMVTRLLHLGHPHIRLARMLVYDGEHLVSSRVSGIAVLQDRTFPTAHPIFNIELPPRSRYQVYVYAETIDSMRWHTTLWEPMAFGGDVSTHRLLVGLLLGIIGVMALYNLVIAAFARQRLHLYLGVMLAAMLALQLVLQDLGMVYLWPSVPNLTRQLVGPALILFAGSFLVFTFEFFGYQDPRRGYLFRRLSLVAVSVAIVTIAATQNVAIMVLFAALLMLPVAGFYAVGVRRALRRDRAASQFVICMTPAVGVTFAMTGDRVLGWGWAFETNQLLMLASAAYLSVALVVTLAWRIRDLERAQQAAAQSAILAKYKVREADHKAEAATQENIAKSAFLATMSHEIRTPMNGVLGMADLLSHTELDSQQAQYVATLSRSGAALLAILNDVLDYSKVEAGRMELETRDVDLIQLLDDVLLLYRDALQRQEIRYYVWLSPEVPDVVRTDPTRLKQIISNLVSNAVKFTESGSVRVEVEVVRGADKPGLVLRFTVTDTGIGMDEEALDGLFDRFKQADSSISRRYGGTGLGLAISRSLAELMGGSLWAQSEAGVGTSMIFEIDASVPAGSRERLGEQTDRRIAYVGEDHDMARMLALWAERSHIGFEHLLSKDAERLPRTVHAIIADEPVGDQNQKNRTLCFGSELHYPPTLTELATRLFPDLAPVSAPRPADAEDNPLTGTAVLVAEDNATNRLLVGKMLTRWGASVTFAENGEEALERLEASDTRFDLVLMDCEMPIMDGYAAAQAIRAKEENASPGLAVRLPIIALTAHALPEYRQRAADAGMTQYVTKPIDRGELLAAIQAAT